MKKDNKLSNFFPCHQGVRQGENLSPILFAIYLNDFQDILMQSYNGLKSLTTEIEEEVETCIKLYTLLYADDTIIMAESAEQLQTALNQLNEYCGQWNLKINTDKTKIVIFSANVV